VTAQGTRAARDKEELLSIFENNDAARDILRELIAARLLTTYDFPAAEDEESGRTRVEIIHESLLTAWPRLVRWQTQDQEGAQLRDELRQAAQLWEQHNRSADRLWTGTAVKEFQLWRERYSGGLTTTEEAFAQAMVQRAERQRRRKRGGLAAASRTAGPSRRGQPTRCTRSLGDGPLSHLEARRFTVEALWRGPTARILPLEGLTSWSAEFSPDGRWLASFTFSENVLLFPEDGGPPRVIGGQKQPTGPPRLAFTPEGDALLTQTRGDPRVRVHSIPDGREIRVRVS
jgi:hypothetical protein